MEPAAAVFVRIIMRGLQLAPLYALMFSFLKRVRFCVKAWSNKAVVDDDARDLFSSDLLVLSFTSFKLIFHHKALSYLLLTVLLCIVGSKMEELCTYIKQHRKQLKSLERRAKNLKEKLALNNDRLLEENKHLGSEVRTKTEQVNAAETNAAVVNKQYMELIVDYDRLLEENTNLKEENINLKNQSDWEIDGDTYRYKLRIASEEILS